ncbi:hypothetical protein Bxe_C0848 [Paraburkholderia xenovorans LB400]|uniref:Uncharacterized protein n=1 Tax=Paraburkholderia xenovorans (strain LB400) TaxID=266265 RepID=Q13GR2_PARXL|nr:hypothetical protein Bxe_C0848 [Paraburkholderia xenovorans LB400]
MAGRKCRYGWRCRCPQIRAKCHGTGVQPAIYNRVETSLDEYLEYPCEAVRHSHRRSGVMGYGRGLLLPIRRKRLNRWQRTWSRSV